MLYVVYTVSKSESFVAGRGAACATLKTGPGKVLRAPVNLGPRSVGSQVQEMDGAPKFCASIGRKQQI